jgi:hypothetical protein
VVNPVGKYYNLYRDAQGTQAIYYEELSNPLKSINLGNASKVYYRIENDLKSQF